MAHLIFGSSPMVSQMPPMAMAMQKHIMEHVKVAAEEQAMMALQQQSQQGGQQPMPMDEVQFESMAAQFMADGLQKVKEMSGQLSGQGPDPLVQLKEKELELRAQSEQNDTQIDQGKLQLDQQSLAMRNRQFGERLAAQDRLTQARIDSAMDRELLKQQNKGN